MFIVNDCKCFENLIVLQKLSSNDATENDTTMNSLKHSQAGHDHHGGRECDAQCKGHDRDETTKEIPETSHVRIVGPNQSK